MRSLSRPRRKPAAIYAVLALLAGLGAIAVTVPEREKPALGLLTTLPIYWAETADLGELLRDSGEPHWARAELEDAYRLIPLDTLGVLTGENAGQAPHLLFLAQPRALSPEENVALDQWVRRGGKVLVMADPMLTGHSRFALGDRRRPQDVVLISPILARWGLTLRFDLDQGQGEHVVRWGGIALPLNLAGQLEAAPEGSAAPGACTIGVKGAVADCRIGEGRAVILADAAVLEVADGKSLDNRREALIALAEKAFGPT